MSNTVKDIYQSMEYGPALENDAPAQDWLKAHDNKVRHYIGGKFVTSDKSFDSKNPANGSFLAKVPQATAKDVDKAVRAAKKALP